MPFKNFSDFQEIKGNFLLPTDFIVGYRELNKEFKTTIADLTIEIVKNLDLAGAPEVLYVTPAGKDTNSGRSEINALRTIKRAAAKALELSRGGANEGVEQSLGAWGITSRAVNIFVRTGTYVEDNPIYLPPSCTIVGDDLRSVTIIPKNKFHDIIWVNNRCYVWGITFRQHKYPSYCIAYPEFKTVAGIDRTDYPNTRVATATARAFNFYYNPNTALTYSATEEYNENSQDLADDFGNPIFDPFRIAFLGRYFQGLNDIFYTEEETLAGVDFFDTAYFKEKVRRPYQLTSPYPQGCSSITQSTSAGAKDAGGGVLVDGSRVDGPLRSMVMDSITQFNEGGKGIHIINNGYAQLVSTFTICCTEGVMCETGGTCSINTSNCSFGDYGLVALGKSPKPTLIGKLRNSIDSLTNQMEIYSLGEFGNQQEFQNDFQPYPGQCFQIKFDTVNPLVTATNNGFLFSVLTASPIVPDPLFPGTYKSIIQLEQNYSPQNDESLTKIPTPYLSIPAGSKVFFYIRSTITTSAHTMEYIGTGTVLLSAVPQKGGITDVEKEVVFDDVGRVYFTSTNQFGDFKIGKDLTIVQATGTIEGDTFKRSILQIVTPFVLSVSQ